MEMDEVKYDHVLAELKRYGLDTTDNISSILSDFSRLRRNVLEYDFVEQLTLDDGSYNSSTQVKFVWQKRKQ